MIPGVRHLREACAHDATGDFAVSGDNGSPLVDWDLDGVEGLGSAFVAQFAPTGSSKVADPFGLAIGRYQIASPADFDGNDRNLAGLTGATANHGEGGNTTAAHPHGHWICHPPSERRRLQIGHRHHLPPGTAVAFVPDELTFAE
jgi:hypothetical protein